MKKPQVAIASWGPGGAPISRRQKNHQREPPLPPGAPAAPGPAPPVPPELPVPPAEPVPELPVPLPLEEGAVPLIPVELPGLLELVVEPPMAPELVPLACGLLICDDEDLELLDFMVSQAVSPSAATAIRGTATRWRRDGRVRGVDGFDMELSPVNNGQIAVTHTT